MDGRLQYLRQMLEAKKADGLGGVRYGRRSERLASAARRDWARKGGVRERKNWVDLGTDEKKGGAMKRKWWCVCCVFWWVEGR